MTEQSGREPALSGADFNTTSTGQEPMLGGERMVAMLRERMLQDLHNPLTSHLRRLQVGLWLNDMGDSREGVGLSDDGLPRFAWEAINKGVVNIHDRSGRDATFEVNRFWIARYPVTWQQYAVFLNAPEGHHDPRWWEGLRRRQDYPRSSEPRANHPVQEVSWYDCLAYCRWYSAQTGIQVRLPTEWEWQYAANAGDAINVYPWGRDWRSNFANTRESRLRQVTAVGMYPQSASPFAVLDMCGTVQEWCQNLYTEPSQTYIGGEDLRVTRGGSWFTVRDYAHTFFRTGYDPYNRYNSVGFRLACDDPLPSPD